jgi:hypothetical protein
MGEKTKDSAADPLAARKKLTFAQAEGIAPLPSQLKRREISQEFRALIWNWVRRAIETSSYREAGRMSVVIRGEGEFRGASISLSRS